MNTRRQTKDLQYFRDYYATHKDKHQKVIKQKYQEKRKRIQDTLSEQIKNEVELASFVEYLVRDGKHANMLFTAYNTWKKSPPETTAVTTE